MASTISRPSRLIQIDVQFMCILSHSLEFIIIIFIQVWHAEAGLDRIFQRLLLLKKLMVKRSQHVFKCSM